MQNENALKPGQEKRCAQLEQRARLLKKHLSDLQKLQNDVKNASNGTETQGNFYSQNHQGKGANYRPTKKGAGMTAKGVRAYRKANPGSKLKTAVTGKVKKGSKAAKRRKSYCARSLGQLKRSSSKTKNDPNSRIRQARRRWKC